MTKELKETFEYFKHPYAYKMGGTQTILLPSGESMHFDDRKYYSGRGSRFNASIRHHELGEVKVTQRQYDEYQKHMARRAVELEQREAEERAFLARIEDAKHNGVYSLRTTKEGCSSFVELSDKVNNERSMLAGTC